MDRPPEKPWKEGKQPDYTCIRLDVLICEDKDGAVWSEHSLPLSSSLVAQTLQGGGARQVAHALMVEALRREVFTDVLVELSKGSGYLDRYIQASDEGKREIESHLANAAFVVLAGLLPKMLPGISREILGMVALQAAGAGTPT